MGFVDGRCMESGGMWCNAASMAESQTRTILFMLCVTIILFVVAAKTLGGIRSVVSKQKGKMKREGAVEPDPGA